MALLSVSPKLVIGFVLVVTITASSNNAPCYAPNGTETSAVACKNISPGDVTHCCFSTDMCTVNGYCAGASAHFYRGGCTDQTWTSRLCPELCATANTGGFSNFFPCVTGHFDLGNWTCDWGEDDNCKTDEGTFSFKPGSLFVPADKSVQSTDLPIATASSTGIASGNPNQESCPAHQGTLIGVGVGLGAALGLSAIAALTVFSVERRKRKAAERLTIQVQAFADQQQQMKETHSVSGHDTRSQYLHEIGSSYGQS